MVNSQHFVQGIIYQHQQKFGNSCIPSAVEMVLKLLRKAPVSYYDLQDGWTTNSSFANFDGQTICGVTFRRINLSNRGQNFPIDHLFEIIDQELTADRYVIIALLEMSDNGPCFHAYVLFEKDQLTQDYVAVTKARALNGTYVTQFGTNIKARVCEIQGTDILVYTIP